MTNILRTQEVGSLAKPDWRVQPITNNILTDQNILDAHIWADRLGIAEGDVEATLGDAQDFLIHEGVLDQQRVDAVKNLAARYAVRLQEKAGIAILYDGEQDRPEMYQDAVAKTNGFEWRGRIRAFDKFPAKSFLKGAIVGPPSVSELWHTDEVDRLHNLTEQDIKVPITGAYTIADWSFDEYYQKSVESGGLGLSKSEAKKAFVLDIADNVIRPNIEVLLESGATWIKIDEPAEKTKPDEVELFVDSFN
ncbi:MAG: hypothetical protein AAB914_00850, partial [Patescibacteria group bacterium]